MASKNTLPNSGVPLWVDPKTELPARSNSMMDSWYFVCSCECEGKKLGFQWHQQIMAMPGGMKFGQAEIELMAAETQDFVSDVVIAPVSEAVGSDPDELHVFSPVGELTGDHKKMHLKAQCEKGNFDVEMVTNHILYNGVTGLLNFMGNSYQFGFTDMIVNGSLEIEGAKYEVKDAVAWFDRQWTLVTDSADAAAVTESESGGGNFMPSWLWIGMALNTDGDALSLWDCYTSTRNSFATVTHANGVQTIVPINVEYEKTWTSEKTGAVYPRKFTVEIPQEDISLKFDSLLDKPEVVIEASGIHGSQNLCTVTGSFHGQEVSKDIIVELVGDICGELPF